MTASTFNPRLRQVEELKAANSDLESHAVQLRKSNEKLADDEGRWYSLARELESQMDVIREVNAHVLTVVLRDCGGVLDVYSVNSVNVKYWSFTGDASRLTDHEICIRRLICFFRLVPRWTIVRDAAVSSIPSGRMISLTTTNMHCCCSSRIVV